MLVRPTWRSRLYIPLIYLGIPLLFFLPALLSQQVPLPLANIYGYNDSLWAAHRPASVRGDNNFTLQDLPNYYYPYMDVAVPELQQGHMSLWNPYIYSGMPFMAAHQPALLYPLNLLFAPLGPKWIWVATAIVRLFLMGWGLHLFMRQLGMRDNAALWSGICYQLCASGIVWLNFGIHNVLACLPLALYGTERLLALPRGRWFMLLVGCLAIQFLGGHPETSTLFGAVWGSWTVVRIPWRKPGRALLLVGLAVLAAVGLSLPQLIPTVDLVLASGTLARRPAIGAVGAWSNLRYWLLLINPYLSGTPVGNRYWSSKGNYNEYAVYMGFLTMPWAIAGAVRGRPRHLVAFWMVLAVVSLGLRFPLPGLDRIYGLRLLQVGAGIRFSLSWSLAAAVLAGFGVEAVMRGSMRRRFLVVGLATGCLALLLYSVYSLIHAAPGQSVLGDHPGQEALRKMAAFYQWGNPQLVAFVGLAIVGCGLMGGLLLSRARPFVPALLLLVVVGDLFANGILYNGYIEPGAIYPPTPATIALQARGGHFRIEVLEGHIMPGNASMTQRLDNALGNDDLVSLRYLQFANRSNNVDRVERTNVMRPLAQRFCDLANVEFLFTTHTLSSASGTRWPLWKKDGDARIYRNPSVLPRAYAVATIKVVAPTQAIDAVYDPAFDPRQTAVVEEPVYQSGSAGSMELASKNEPDVSFRYSGNQGSHLALEARTTIVSYQPERVVLDADVAKPALVVLSDSYAAGWQVAVDGVPTHMYRANAVFRGVFVSSGRHQIVFRYVPQDVLWGTVVAGSTLLLCLLSCWQLHRHRLKRGIDEPVLEEK